jgi:hypothetical protein
MVLDPTIVALSAARVCVIPQWHSITILKMYNSFSYCSHHAFHHDTEGVQSLLLLFPPCIISQRCLTGFPSLALRLHHVTYPLVPSHQLKSSTSGGISVRLARVLHPCLVERAARAVHFIRGAVAAVRGQRNRSGRLGSINPIPMWVYARCS